MSKNHPSHQPLAWGDHLKGYAAAAPLLPAAPEWPSTREGRQGGASSAGLAIRLCCGPAKGQALRASCQAAGRGLGVDLVDWNFTHLPPD